MSESDDGATTSMPLVGPGRVVGGRYELVSTLGSGGMAVVFLARDQVLGREVAVKILREQFASDPVLLDRFTREALHAAGLSHPGLVTIFDAGVDRGTAYIVMEVVSGRTLHDILVADGRLDIERSVRIAADVCDVLDVAHRAGVVHRDIKPGNISISDTGRTRVFDFGIARTDGSIALTEASTVVGTAAYLSPEQAAGGPAEPRSDLYSVGCVLMEMLTGSPPFSAETPVALLHQHLNDEATAPSVARPEVGAALDDVVRRLLSKDPAERPETAAAARLDLLSTLASSPRATRVLPTLEAAAEPRRARPPQAMVVVAGASVLAAVRSVVTAAQGAALIEGAAATQIERAVDEVAVAVEKAKGKAAVPRAQGLVDLVASLARDGRIDAAAAVPLQQATARLRRLVSEGT